MDYQTHKTGSSIFAGGYVNDSLLTPRQFYPTGFEQTLEKIVLDEPPAPGQSFLDTVLGEKQKSLKAVALSFFNEISGREQLSSAIVKGLTQRILDTYTNLHEIRDITSRSYSLDLALNLSRRKTQLEDRIIGLERDKRQEYIACWEALMKLRQYLVTSLKDYWEFTRKTTHLGYGENVEG